MDRNSTFQVSLKACGPIFWNQSIELNNPNNFCSICVMRIFTSKKLWKFCRNFIVDFRVQASFGAFRATKLKLKLERQLYLVCSHKKIQLCISYRFWEKPRTTTPSKNEQNDYFSKPEVTSSKQKKVYQIFMIYYKSWKFHGNRSNRFWEIGCTKSVRKIIIIEKKKQ